MTSPAPRATLDKDPHDVAGMFDSIAPRYDITNDLMTGFMVRRWRVATRDAVGTTPGMRVLDVAAGTGTSSRAWADAGVEVVPLDFSQGMVAQGKKQNPDLPFVVGDATALPFADETFDAVTISYGLRNVGDTDAALGEFYRVTKPGGRVVICEFSRPTWRPFRTVYYAYLSTVLPTVARIVASQSPAYGYLTESIRDWPDQQELGEQIAAAGWERVAYRNLAGGIVALHRAFRPLD